MTFERRVRLNDWTAALILLAVGLLPRIVLLGADPPADVSPSFIFDEGWWAHNARNRILFGQWVLDEHNPSLLVTPLYTVLLAGVYAIAGVDLVSTRLLSALAGFLACVTLYAGFRRDRAPREALIPALILATSYAALSQSRLGLTETLQLLWLTLVFVGVLRSDRALWSGVAGGALVLAMLVKPSALMVAPVLGAYWLWHRARADATEARPRALPFLVVAVTGAALLAFLLVEPNWSMVSQQLARSRLAVTTSVVGPRQAWSHVGFGDFGLTFNRFFAHSAALFTAIALLAATRLLRRAALSRAELLSWLWLVIGLATISLQRYQPDRRLLFLMPAVAILAAEAFRRGALRLAVDEGLRPTSPRVLLAGLALGGWLAFLAYAGAAEALGDRLERHLPLLAGRTGANLTLLAGILVAWLGFGWLARAGRARWPRGVTVPSLVLVAAFVALEPARFTLTLARPTFTIRDAARDLGRLSSGWGPEDRIIVGGQAATFALESSLRPIRIISDGGPTENRHAWERLHPAAAVSFGRPDQDALERGFVRCRSYDVWPDWRGRPTWRGVQLLVRPDLCPPRVAGR
ncbi:MAG: glycosyltransferase family 39 protein [Gemmatimonadales bacterium]